VLARRRQRVDTARPVADKQAVLPSCLVTGLSNIWLKGVPVLEISMHWGF